MTTMTPQTNGEAPAPPRDPVADALVAGLRREMARSDRARLTLRGALADLEEGCQELREAEAAAVQLRAALAAQGVDL